METERAARILDVEGIGCPTHSRFSNEWESVGASNSSRHPDRSRRFGGAAEGPAFSSQLEALFTIVILSGSGLPLKSKSPP